MKAFLNDAKVKEKYLERVRAHRSADQLIKGTYWEGGKGCAVGCTIHSAQHANYETELGIPRRIAYIEDRLFERMPNENAMTWPERFLEAIPVGADLSQVVDRWLHWMLTDEKEGTITFAKTDKTREAIKTVGELYARRLNGTDPTRDEWLAARSLCRQAWYASYDAAADAADAAAAAAAADAADAAADAAAADADAAAADAAADDADAAADDADAAADDAAADDAAIPRWSETYSAAYAARILRLSEKLLELLAAAPVPAMEATNQ